MAIKANLTAKPSGVTEPYGKVKVKDNRDLTSYYNEQPTNDVVLEL